MVQDYNGATVIDATGEAIGTVERSYVDDAGAVRLVSVKLGKLFAKHRLVPVDAARRQNDELRIPYTKQTVEDSPDVDADDTLEGDALARVRAYYTGPSERTRAAVPEAQPAGTEGSSVRTETSPREVAGIRDRGDTIEVPIVEEELVKRPVVKEVLRIRKSTTTEQRQLDEDLRKEDVEVSREGDVDIRGSGVEADPARKAGPER